MESAYIAGLVDGEGCISVNYTKRTQTYGIVIYLGMTEPAKSLLHRMAAIYGGSVNLSRKSTDVWANAYMWRVTGEKAKKMLIDIVDHLRVKDCQARLAIHLQDQIEKSIPAGMVNPVWTTELRAIGATVKMEMSDLNMKGPTKTQKSPIDGFKLHARIAGDIFLMPKSPGLFDPTGWEPLSVSFPESGMLVGGHVWTHDGLVSHSADDAYSVCSLAEMLERDVAPKYYLSPTACAGILRRAKARGKEIKGQLKDALEAVASQLPEPGP